MPFYAVWPFQLIVLIGISMDKLTQRLHKKVRKNFFDYEGIEVARKRDAAQIMLPNHI